MGQKLVVVTGGTGKWFDRIGWTGDRPALRREFADVAFHDFESWAKAQDWKTLLQLT
jgi:hypothetical protein